MACLKKVVLSWVKQVAAGNTPCLTTGLSNTPHNKEDKIRSVRRCLWKTYLQNLVTYFSRLQLLDNFECCAVEVEFDRIPYNTKAEMIVGAVEITSPVAVAALVVQLLKRTLTVDAAVSRNAEVAV